MEKTDKRFIRILLFVFLIAALTVACGLPSCSGPSLTQKAATAVLAIGGTYDEGVQYYNDALVAASNFQGAKDTSLAKINSAYNVLKLYTQADVAKSADYRSKVAQANADAMKALPKTANGQPDLAEAEKQGLLPPQWVNGGFTVVANVITEAPVASVPDSVANNVLSIQTGAYDYLDSSIQDWNKAAGKYNTWRQSVTEGRILTDVAKHFGLTNLPDSLPMYTSSTGSSGVPVPTTAP
jgi:hypothetical protein